METNGSNQEVVQGSRATVVYDTPGMEAPNPQEQTANTASDIEERLSSLATAPQEEAAPTVDAPAPTEETKSELPSLDELDIPEDLGVQNTNFETPEAKKLDADLKAILGIGLQDIADGAKSLKEVQQHFQEVQAQQYRTQVLNELTSTWGVTGQELDSRVDAVYERFQKYPPDMQSRLDNLEGIQLIWAKIQQEQQIKGVPQFQKSSGQTSGSKKPMFSREELAKLTPEQYSRLNNQIVYAYQNGLVQ